MDLTQVMVAGIAALSAIASGFFAWHGKQSQVRVDAATKAEEAKADQQIQFYAQVMAECRELRKSNLELQKQVNELQSEVHKLREQLEYYEENVLAAESRELVDGLLNKACKNPVWIHDIGANKWYVNDEYCRLFSVKRPTFWTPINLYGQYDPEDVIEHISNDLKVVEANASIEFTEHIPVRVMDPKCRETRQAKFNKTPIVINDRPYVFGRLVSFIDGKDCREECSL